MQPEFKDTILYEKGYTVDICNSLVYIYKKYRDLYDDTAFHEQFRASTLAETGRRIFDYVVRNFTYREDPSGQQRIKTPARLLYLKVGDCKSFSLFVNTMLWRLGWKPYFRFACYNTSGEYTHVYTVVYDRSGQPLVIDTVAYLQKNMPYGSEARYIKKIDMETTQISCLSGFSGIAGDGADMINDWLAGKTAELDAEWAKTIENGINRYIESSNTGSVDMGGGTKVKKVKVNRDGSSILETIDGTELTAVASFTKSMVDAVNSIPIENFSSRENPIYGQLNSYLNEQSRIKNQTLQKRYEMLGQRRETSYMPLILAGAFLLALVVLKGDSNNGHKKRRR